MLFSVLIIAGSVAAAALALRLVSRASASQARKESNDFTGAVVAVIGTTYAVILAFLLSGLWNLYQQAKTDTELEAADVVNIFRVARQFEEPERSAIEELDRRYAETVINTEWPQMVSGAVPQGGGAIINDLWTAAGQVKTNEATRSLAVGELMSSLSSLTEHRGVRIMRSNDALPGILWLVLVSGGMVTVGAACFFGVPSFRFHLLQVVALSFLISLILVAIADVDRPYQGNVRIEPDGFRYALRTMSEEARK